YTYLIDELQLDGIGHRTMFTNPPSNSKGVSGEARLTRTVTEGPRLHTLHLSLRGRQTRREFGGDDEIALGTSSIFEDIDTPRPTFEFGEQSHERLRQLIYG